MKQLGEIKTEDLIEELKNRDGVESISVGPYAPYELKKKYSNDRAVLSSDLVLVVNHLDA